jgi:acyl-homoserine-lactone acylase
MNQRTRWVRAGLITQAQADAIASFERARVRAGFVRAIFGLAILAIGMGFLVLVASRWDRLSDWTKLGGHALLNLGAIGLVWRALRRPTPEAGGEPGGERNGEGDRSADWAANWTREGGLGLLLGLNLSFLLLVAHTLDLKGPIAQLLIVWMLISTPALLRWGQSLWLASAWTVGLLVTAVTFAVDLVDRLPEWAAFLNLYATALLVPTLLLLLGSTQRVARMRPVWATVWRLAGVLLLLAGASLSTGLWYTDMGATLRRLAGSAIPVWGLWAFLGAVLAMAVLLVLQVGREARREEGRVQGQEADRPIALLSLGVMALPALTFAGDWGLLGAFVFMGYWSALGWIGVRSGSHLLMGLAVWLVAGRVLVLTLEYFGGMFATGLGLVLGGVLILGFLRLVTFLQARLRSAVGSSEMLLPLLLLLLFLLPALGPSSQLSAQLSAQQTPDWQTLSRQAEITRTTRGIPHIQAENATAAGFALGWVQMEDYGPRVVELLVAARGETARLAEAVPSEREARVRADVRARRTLRAAEQGFPTLSADLQGMYAGFAAAVNRWLELHPEDAHPAVRPDFTAQHVLARDIPGPDWAAAERYLRTRPAEPSAADWRPGLSPEPGSNTWALAPERTTSGHAILMRNPHLAWTAGYYEGHLQIADDLNFYGDFRIGGPFSVIGGWNDRLGWSTTNNAPELSDLYWLTPHPDNAERVFWDGTWVPLTPHLDTIGVWEGESMATRVVESWESPIGPVVHRGAEGALVVRTAGDGNPRLGEQFLAMMRARTLDAWLDAMRMQARTQSNFTYADADGNIFYVWNAMHPVRPHPHGADTLAHPVDHPAQVWQTLLPFDALPQLLNPPGGYLRNENDSFHYTNLGSVLRASDYPPEAEYPQLRLRSQHSLELLGSGVRFSLEEVVALRASERMILADRVLPDLLDALRTTRPPSSVVDPA